MVGLLAVSGANIFGMSDDRMEAIVCQIVIDRDSVFPCGFHTNIATIEFAKPVYKFDQIGLVTGKFPKMVDRFIGDLRSYNDTTGKLSLVEIDATANGIHDSAHKKSPF